MASQDLRILVINCGSTTLKYQLFQNEGAELMTLAVGSVEIREGYRKAVGDAVAALPQPPDAIAHRVVHGGDRLTDIVRIDTGVLSQLRELGPLAPLHNGPALEGIEATLGSDVPLLAAFDTSFHRTLPERAWRYALPELGTVRRYGFHGWSHRSVVQRYAELSGNPQPTIVTLHLGSGCSAAAIQRGESIDTSMGFTPLEGLVMGTRAGDLDPGILTHLMDQGMTLHRLRRLLHHESGLHGLAGTDDMRELLRREDEAARLAIEIFCYRVLKYVGAYLTVLGGAEAIVFTGGIGERSPEIRRRICQELGWLGLTLDEQRNTRGDECISSPTSRLAAYCIHAEEERVIAREACRLLASGAPDGHPTLN
jgi:acetate kinase